MIHLAFLFFVAILLGEEFVKIGDNPKHHEDARYTARAVAFVLWALGVMAFAAMIWKAAFA